ncbi:succinyl-diaminopimelate desuccinylase [Roseobacter denitrificans]|uniref:Succinyl-diaminopimelate desuccinylase n=1 Tax=Roseobacter denitrificans (strain ATCC 33942 / OCh 114) TaxID=375451 RepID=DAPE_ROSDO|nr:succinyl-diaminopimelate desuccinylase [Roseobacter denitrificans]Q16DM9.1 RecName: Full=Succinyl-diaminopimelate desuccinylase; Short=SDAP desuccinylase; AltName: Full=N-succinyl-LL-2,6-diaminoheptanedioate amidohydrolase [Roseobacter denitrificans OCh 114]ABG29914.1 putative succinyl-diaminopimelate desuccinylase [Roseobacter denitrificans OCh 114]AVL53127.1 succinyl-diaminopimelate desuccinylase [Roseobacter denitrificans]SFG38109.1 succinyldiaminopimelate desuccinylase [Roseobacter denit
MPAVDPVRLTADLVRCASVTPADEGALDILHDVLSDAGFDCAWADRGGIRNLFARWGRKGHPKTFGFNGHTDVVPIGNADDWSMPPFGAEVKDGIMYGRGTTDMKSGVAAFAAAAVDFVRDTPPDGAIVLAITGDEEGDATDGTTALLAYMAAQGEQMSACLVGEPTCPDRMGEMIKIGRRGSMTAWITFIGKQGHAAYPHRACNPLPALMRLMDRLASHKLDEGTEFFDPSTLAIVTVDTGNPATNVIPASCSGTVNIRFNDAHSGASLTEWIKTELSRIEGEFGVQIDLRIKISGESFLTPPGPLSALVSKAVKAQTGIEPVLSTTGGTSDARFVKDHCPVVEFGLVGQSMHQVDEHVKTDHIVELKAIYSRILTDYFA